MCCKHRNNFRRGCWCLVIWPHPKMYYSKLERSLYQRYTVEVKTVSMRSVIVNSHHPNTFLLSECPQQVGHATNTIASGYTYKWSHDVAFNHSSARRIWLQAWEWGTCANHNRQGSSTIRNAPKIRCSGLQLSQPPLHIVYLLQGLTTVQHVLQMWRTMWERRLCSRWMRLVNQSNLLNKVMETNFT